MAAVIYLTGDLFIAENRMLRIGSDVARERQRVHDTGFPLERTTLAVILGQYQAALCVG